MVNYQLGKIYKITGGDLTYIGSTTKSLSQRLAHHNSDYRRFLEGKRKYSLTSFQVLECPDYAISLLEKFPCNDKDELNSRERYWIENTDCVNRFIPNRTKAEHYLDNKEKILQKNKTYRLNNAENVNKKKAEYREENRQILAEKQRLYRQRNADEIRRKQCEKWTCECGSVCNRNNRSAHFKSQKHKIFTGKQQSDIL